MKPGPLIAGLSIVVIGSAVYAQAIHVPLVLDDIGSVVANPTITDLTRLSDVLSPPPDTTVAGRPVANLSFALDMAITHGRPEGFHLTNILIHLINGLLIFALIRRLGGRSSVALAIALLWLVHPLQTQAVTYVSQRVESLMALFCLLTLYAAARGWLLAAILACGMGMGAKEGMVGVPLLVVLMDRAFLFESWREAWRARRALYAGLAATWLVLLALMASHPRDLSTGLHAASVGSFDYFRMQCIVVAAYVVMVFHPVGLVFDYGDAIASIAIPRGWGEWLPGAIVLTGLGVCAAWAWWSGRRTIGFLGAWFFTLLAPSSSFVPVVTEPAAEHRMYLPMLAPIALVVGLIAWLSPKIMWAIPVAILVGLLGRETILRNGRYATEFSLWQDSATNWPASSRVFLHWGMAAEKAGDHGHAEQLYLRAVGIDSNESWAHYHLGQELDRRGAWGLAAMHYRECLHRISRPGLVEFHLGNDLMHLGRSADALMALREAVEAEPQHWEYVSKAAAAQVLTGDDNGLREHLRVLHYAPDFPGAHLDYAGSLWRLGRIEEARAELAIAIHLDRTNGEAWRKLGMLDAISGLADPARRCLEYATIIDPYDVLARESLRRWRVEEVNSAAQDFARLLRAEDGVGVADIHAH